MAESQSSMLKWNRTTLRLVNKDGELVGGVDIGIPVIHLEPHQKPEFEQFLKDQALIRKAMASWPTGG